MRFKKLTLARQRAAARAMKARITKHALDFSVMLDPRTLAVLEKHKILKRAGSNEPTEVVVAVVRDENHPNRLKLLPGPLVVLIEPQDNSKRTVIPVSCLLFAAKASIRSDALNFFKRLSSVSNAPMLPNTSALIDKWSSDLLSDKDSAWRTAAVAISDAVSVDFLLNLAAVQQSLAIRYDQGLREYLPLVLRPSPQLLDTAKIPNVEPSAQKDEIRGLLDSMLQQSTGVDDLATRYQRELGHLPLTLEFSLGALVQRWIAGHGLSGQEWDSIWKWADEAPSTTAEYHACQVMLANPTLVPNGNASLFWDKVLRHVRDDEKEGHKPVSPWRMVDALARYYAHYLECHFPGGDGERISVMALWLAGKVQSAFGKTEEMLAYLGKWLEGFSNIQSRIWRLSTPPVRPSALRLGVTSDPSFWLSSLLCAMSQNSENLDLSGLTDEQLQELDLALLTDLAWLFPAASDPCKDQGVYAFSNGFLNLVRKRIGLDRAADSRAQLQAFLDMHEKLADPSAFTKFMDEMRGEQAGGKITASLLLRQRAQMNTLPLDDLWTLVRDDQWREGALLSDNRYVYEFLFDTFLAIHVHNDDKWRSELPHIFALTCDKAQPGESQNMLFAFVVASAISIGNVSALERLLKGSTREKYREQVEHWRNQLAYLMPDAPGWVAGRMRAVMASLHVE